jgi:hypothetical protein
MLVGIAVSLGGCAGTKQARSVEPTGFLVDRSILEKGKEDEALLRYENPDIDITRYTQALIDPVLIYRPTDASQAQLADLQKLATNFHVYLSHELGKDYTITKTPGPGVMRIQAAITSASESRAVSDLMTSVIPIGMGVSAVKEFATGKPVGTGEVSAEVKITDAQTGELIGAGVDERVGGKDPRGIFNSWNDADEGIQFWAKRLRYVLCERRGGIDCVKP